MGFIAPVVGVISAVGGAITSANAAASQNAANAMQIEANRREEKIRLMDVEAQRQSNFLDFEVSSQQRVAALASALTSADIARLDNRTQRAIQSAQINTANSALDVNSSKAQVGRENQQENMLAQAAKARGIDTQNVPYDKLAQNVLTQRAAIYAALNPRMADLYRTGEESALLSQYDTLRNAEGDQRVQVDYAQQYGDLIEQFADVTKETGDVAAGYQLASAKNALNATDAMQQNSFAANDSMFGVNQEMTANASKIDQLGAYRKLLAGENISSAQEGNIRSATSAKNVDVSRNNRSYSLFDSLPAFASAGVSLFNAFQEQSQQQQTPQLPQAPRVSDSRYDINYRGRQDYFG
jgi:hypothetical protein